jgi:hypothetical protein
MGPPGITKTGLLVEATVGKARQNVPEDCRDMLCRGYVTPSLHSERRTAGVSPPVFRMLVSPLTGVTDPSEVMHRRAYANRSPGFVQRLSFFCHRS